MTKNHIKRVAAPKTWPIKRKIRKWITKPSPGAHKVDRSLPLNVILKEILNYAKTTREVNNILNTGRVRVNNIARKDNKFGVGVMDILSFDDTKEYFRMLLDSKGKLFLHKVNEKDGSIVPRKIIRKNKIRGNLLQITFYGGLNKNFKDYEHSVSDTAVFDNIKGEIVDHFKFEKGSIIYITSGKKSGAVGTIKDIKERDGLKQSILIFNSKGKDFETLKDYAFVIGKSKAIIDIPENE